MYADPVRKIQEQLYEQLIAIREGFAQTLTTAIAEADKAPQNGSAAVEEVKEADSQEVIALRAENKKLNYRVVQLLRTIDEIEDAQAKWNLESQIYW